MIFELKYPPFILINQLNQPIWQALQSALTLLNEQQIAAASATLTTSLPLIDWKDSETLGLALNIINFYYQINSFQSGLVFLEKAMHHFPDAAELYYLQSLGYQQNYQLLRAADSLRQALHLEQQTPARFKIVKHSLLVAIYLELSKVQLSLKEFSPALASLEKAIVLEPDEPIIRELFCRVLKASGMNSSALWDYLKKYLSNSNHLQILQWAEAFYLVNEAQLCLATLELVNGLAVEISGQIELLKAKAYLKLRDYQTAAVYLQKSQLIADHSQETFTYQMITLWQQSDFKKVADLLEANSVLSKQQYFTFKVLNLLLNSQNLFFKFTKFFLIKIKQPKFFEKEILLDLLWKLTELKAEQLSVHLNTLCLPLIENQFTWGRLLFQRGMLELAADTLLTTLNQPEVPSLKYRLLGEICFQKGLYLEAINLLQMFLEEEEHTEVRGLLVQAINAFYQNNLTMLNIFESGGEN